MADRRVEHVMRETCPECRQHDCPSLRGCATPRERFAKAMTNFIAAGHVLVEVWDGEDFNADDEFGPCAIDEGGQFLFPLSLDEWLLELQAWSEKE